jgi:hypothetical protein
LHNLIHRICGFFQSRGALFYAAARHGGRGSLATRGCAGGNFIDKRIIVS